MSEMVSSRGLTAAEIDDLLGRPITSRLATVRPDGAPYVVPIWHFWDGAALWVIPRERSSFVEHIRREPRVFLSCADDGPGHARVSIEGTAHIADGPSKLAGRALEIAREMGSRYLGPVGVEYIGHTIDRPRYLIRIDPVKVTSWQGGEWHPRYFSQDRE
jgi:PPOX class probable F420-dependent enzyme